MAAAVVVVVAVVALCSLSQTLLTTGSDVTDDRWHVTTLKRRQRSLELRVDNDTNKVKGQCRCRSVFFVSGYRTKLISGLGRK